MRESLTPIEWLRRYRWPVFFGLLAISATSWLIWLWERGELTLFSGGHVRLEEATALEQIQSENDALRAEVEQLKEQLVSSPPNSDGGTVAGERAEAGNRININTASPNELEDLPGIGPSKAAAIVEYRQTQGPFTAPEEITNVNGIGDGTYQGLKDFITVR